MPVPRFQTRAELESFQWTALSELLATNLADNPFLRAKVGDTFERSPLIDLADFRRRFPFTTKAELAADHASNPPFGTNLALPVDAYTRCHQTSGSTGRPLRWLDTNESWAGLLDSWGEVYREARVTPTDRIFFAFSFGPFLGFWTAFESALRIGCLCFPGGGLSSEARLQHLLETGCTILCCTPTYALRLAEVAAEQGVDASGSAVRLIIVAGEPGGSLPAIRQRIGDAWGARVFDHHGMTEVGPVTHELHDHPGVLRVVEPAYLAEVVNPQTGGPAPEGETGELVLTTLGRVASPLVRYRTGDLVQPVTDVARRGGYPDLCLDGGILGRVDDMVVVRGVNVYPGAIDQIVRECAGIAEYRVTVKRVRSLAELEIAIEPVPDENGELAADQLRSLMQRRLGLRVPVEVVSSGSLPRFEMKAKRWRVERD